jgi:hypothetical protein
MWIGARRLIKMAGLCARCLAELLHKFLGLHVIAENTHGTFTGKLVGFKVNGPHLKIVLGEAKTFTVVDNVTLFRVYDGEKLVFEAQPTPTQEVKANE